MILHRCENQDRSLSVNAHWPPGLVYFMVSHSNESGQQCALHCVLHQSLHAARRALRAWEWERKRESMMQHGACLVRMWLLSPSGDHGLLEGNQPPTECFLDLCAQYTFPPSLSVTRMGTCGFQWDIFIFPGISCISWHKEGIILLK